MNINVVDELTDDCCRNAMENFLMEEEVLESNAPNQVDEEGMKVVNHLEDENLLQKEDEENQEEDKGGSPTNEPPNWEIKPLPTHLMYAYLGENETYLVIVNASLTNEQLERLIVVLERNKNVFAWSIGDIKGISPSICMHKILMNEGNKPVRQPQRRLNPTYKGVVRKDILKLLKAGIIYPISDSEWVSPTQVVPKKGGITVIISETNELLPSRLVTGWRMCIDFRKLNESTRKDHFSLPFY
ncbi:hypothetical protein ACH5RR_018310 [Cinchona calisaya]|uniref:Uncharacterized protein n=1 Tax=Cinchona calisaya TaxID=153742 RepID=A0ABD2ZL26_9GENT